jgi:hypothetical protein
MMTFRLWWISADGEHSLCGGEYSSEHKSEIAIPGFKDKLLSGCRSDEAIADIEAGRFDVEVKTGYPRICVDR